MRDLLRVEPLVLVAAVVLAVGFVVVLVVLRAGLTGIKLENLLKLVGAF